MTEREDLSLLVEDLLAVGQQIFKAERSVGQRLSENPPYLPSVSEATLDLKVQELLPRLEPGDD